MVVVVGVEHKLREPVLRRVQQLVPEQHDPGCRVIENKYSDLHRRKTYLQGECSYIRTEEEEIKRQSSACSQYLPCQGPHDPRMTLSQMARSMDICLRHPKVLMKIRSAIVKLPVVPLMRRRWKSSSLNICEVCQNASG